VGLRQNRHARALAERLPVTGPYERRIAELTRLVRQRSVELERARADLADLEDRTRTWVPFGHFYSPFADLADVRERADAIWRRDPLALPGVDIRLDAQRQLLDVLQPHADGVSFARSADEASKRHERYWSENPAFGEGDALFLVALLRHLRPKRLIELGCGYSSACLLDARERDLRGELDLTFVDPHPELMESLMREGDDVKLIRTGTERLDLDVFTSLAADDVVFVDSTHVARVGSDVNRLFFEILPVLADGVVIHLHDVFPTLEYPAEWVYEGRAWNEQYVLHAFLQYNRCFEVFLWPLLLYGLEPENMARRFPALGRSQGASWWMRKASGSDG
jgi:predicted O-methyltransferase YrrM